MGFHSSVHLFTIILTLTAAASSIRPQPRHDGKSHQAARDASGPELQPRQDEVENEAVGGIHSLSSKPAILCISIPMPIDTASPTVAPPPEPLGQNAPSPVDLPTPTGAIDAYIFPSSIVQVPVATICPDTPFSGALFSLIPISAASSLVNATPLLPNGSSVVHPACSNTPSPITAAPFPSPLDNTTSHTSTRPAAAIANPTARILLDSTGCQTIYSPSYTAVCHTTVRMIGIPDATVMECDQYITFSSDTQAYGGSATPLAEDASVLPTITAHPRTFYAAHWYDVVRGGVPRNVRVKECDGAEEPIPQSTGTATGECVTHNEKWSVSHITAAETRESVVSFEEASPVFSFPSRCS
jgi:hypothetical protein